MTWSKTIPNIGQFTKIPLNIFFLIGFCVIRWHAGDKPRHWQFVFLAIFVFHVTFDMSAMLTYLLFESLETVEEKTAYIIYVTFAGNAFMKLGCVFLNLKKICVAFANISKYYPKTQQQRQDYDLDEHLNSIRRYNKGLTVYHYCVTSMFNLFPLIQCVILYYQAEQSLFLYEMPFPMVYPFDSKQPWGYAFAYATQCSGSYTASCAFVGSDLLLITCVHLINMNFRYLAKSIRAFRPTGALADLEKLKELITYHNDILRTVELVDESFNISIFLNYMGTVIIICLIGFQLVVGTNLLDLVKFLSFLISLLTHVYFISIFGTEMMSLSFDISNAFMHHPWYDAHEKYRRALTLPIARAQKPVHLNAFKFFIISMETFKSLISVSYQFFTLIKTSYVDE